MNIVLISEYFPRSDEREMRGGVEARCFYIARELAKKNRVWVIASREPDCADRADIGAVTVLRVGPRRKYTHRQGLWSRFMFAWSVARTQLPESPDIVDAQAIVTYIPGYWLARRYHARAVMTIHDSWLGQWIRLFGLAGIIGEIVERLYLLLHWDGVIANSRYTLDKVRDRIKAPTEVVYNGIDHQHLPVPAQQAESGTLCVISRLVPYKRVGDVLQALAMLQKQGKRFRCHIIGSGPESERLRQEAEQLGVAAQVVLHGFMARHEDVLRVLQSSMLLCHPSAVEGFGIVTLEAALVNRPYVATSIPAVREVTRDGRGGILYPVGDIARLVQSLEDLLSDPHVYQQKQKELPDLIRHYQWKTQAATTASLYQSLL